MRCRSTLFSRCAQYVDRDRPVKGSVGGSHGMKKILCQTIIHRYYGTCHLIDIQGSQGENSFLTYHQAYVHAYDHFNLVI